MTVGGSCPRRRGRIRSRNWVGAQIGCAGGGVDRVVNTAAGVEVHNGGTRSRCVRGRRIGPGRLHVDAEGTLYVPDSEDEDSEVGEYGVGTGAADEAVGEDRLIKGSPAAAAAAAADGSAGDDLVPEGAPLVGAGSPAGTDLPANGAEPVVAGERTMHPEVAARLAKKVLGEDLHPEVAQRLAMVLAQIDPLFHELFIAMYKSLEDEMPACRTPLNIRLVAFVCADCASCAAVTRS